MGIRFRCPNGHKLHVKAFLAGKRGICPHCGEKFQIPLESDPELVKSSKHASDSVTSTGEGEEVSVAQPQASTRVAPQQRAPAGLEVSEFNGDLGQRQAVADVNTSDRPSTNGSDHPNVAEPTSSPAESEPVEVTPVTQTQAASSIETPIKGDGDPIDEAPHAVWYVRPPSGGQFGPASADVMRSWITEGRVTADSLVWREGWPEWKKAGPLFPNLSDASPTRSVATVPQIVTHGAEGSSAAMYRRRKSNKSTLMIVFMLLIACLILFGALVYVVKFMN